MATGDFQALESGQLCSAARTNAMCRFEKAGQSRKSHENRQGSGRYLANALLI